MQGVMIYQRIRYIKMERVGELEKDIL